MARKPARRKAGKRKASRKRVTRARSRSTAGAKRRASRARPRKKAAAKAKRAAPKRATPKRAAAKTKRARPAAKPAPSTIGQAPLGSYTTPPPLSPIEPMRHDPWERPAEHTEEAGMEDEEDEEPL